jgi:hypothetical protein
VQVLSAFGRTRGAVLTLAAAGAVLAAPAVILVIPSAICGRSPASPRARWLPDWSASSCCSSI